MGSIIYIAIYSQGPKVIPQNYFHINFNIYCMMSRLKSNYFLIVVILNNRYKDEVLTLYFSNTKQLIFHKYFENAVFPMTSIVTLSKMSEQIL